VKKKDVHEFSTCFLDFIYQCDIVVSGDIMPRINKTKYAILGLLHYMPMSGYDIKKMTDNNISNFWQENYGHIYPVLKQMEQKDLVEFRKMESAGSPPRKVYNITEKGRNEFQKWLKEETEPLKIKSELLLKTFFGEFTSPHSIIERLKEEKEFQKNKLLEYEQILQHIESLPKERNYSPFWALTVKNGIFYAKGQIQWCEESIKELQEG